MRKLCLYLLLACAGAVAAFAQPARTGGWSALGPGGTIRVTQGGFALTYEVKPKQIAMAVLPAVEAMAGMQRLRFRVKADRDTALAVLLSERKPGGGNYTAVIWAPAGIWQQVELAPADFIVSDGPNDPVDADGKLDLDQVEATGILDLAQFFSAQPENPEFPVIVDRESGPRTLLLEDFQVLSAAGASSAPLRAGSIDAFDRGFLSWITLGGMKLKLSPSENPLGAPALEASYQQTEGRYGLLLRRLGNLDLSKATRIGFDLASDHEATLVVSLESKTGQRYNLTIYPPGAREVLHVNLRLGDFAGPGELDPAQLKSLAIADISAAGGGATQANRIWIGKVAAPEN